MFDRLTGNGNGNKVNMRIHVLEQILSSIETDGSSARVNSLRQVIRRNKADMADDAGKSLDLMRRAMKIIKLWYYTAEGEWNWNRKCPRMFFILRKKW
uniref:TFIIS N-terminal domain-containing protein n=1 Tax=Angiostrongylus cantonensis TaxID=6313 RepID=A0A0K0D195_ANGCA